MLTPGEELLFKRLKDKSPKEKDSIRRSSYSLIQAIDKADAVKALEAKKQATAAAAEAAKLKAQDLQVRQEAQPALRRNLLSWAAHAYNIDPADTQAMLELANQTVLGRVIGFADHILTDPQAVSEMRGEDRYFTRKTSYTIATIGVGRNGSVKVDYRIRNPDNDTSHLWLRFNTESPDNINEQVSTTKWPQLNQEQISGPDFRQDHGYWTLSGPAPTNLAGLKTVDRILTENMPSWTVFKGPDIQAACSTAPLPVAK